MGEGVKHRMLRLKSTVWGGGGIGKELFVIKKPQDDVILTVRFMPQ
jgi:hypothetical protein